MDVNVSNLTKIDVFFGDLIDLNILKPLFLLQSPFFLEYERTFIFIFSFELPLRAFLVFTEIHFR